MDPVQVAQTVAGSPNILDLILQTWGPLGVVLFLVVKYTTPFVKEYLKTLQETLTAMKETLVKLDARMEMLEGRLSTIEADIDQLHGRSRERNAR